MPIRLLLVVILLLLPMVPTFWAIQDIPKRRFSTRKSKIVWFLLSSTLPFVGAMCYIVFVRKTTEPAMESELSSN